MGVCSVQLVDYPEFRGLIGLAAEDESITALFLIGSYGTPYYSALSDLDFAVLATGTFEIDEKLALTAAFSDILKTDRFDLVFLNDASALLQYEVLKSGRLLYRRDKVLLADFVEQTIKLYCDFSIFINRFYKDWDYGLRQKFL